MSCPSGNRFLFWKFHCWHIVSERVEKVNIASGHGVYNRIRIVKDRYVQVRQCCYCGLTIEEKSGNGCDWRQTERFTAAQMATAASQTPEVQK
jgi:hypothetical protein